MEARERNAEKQPGRVLIVDDDQRTLTLETKILSAAGHLVATAANGDAAIEKMAQFGPDVVLLDVRMPGMSGIDVCRTITSDPATEHVPVILVTGCVERDDRLSGIAAGATDFLNKPIDADELRLCVRNAIHSKHLFDRLHDSIGQLEKLQQMRDAMVQMLVHDMRTPLSSIAMSVDFLSATTERQYMDDRLAAQEYAKGAVRTLQEMVNSMLDVSRLDKTTIPLRPRSCVLSEVLRDALHALKPTMGRTCVVVDEPGTPVNVTCDPDLIRRVLVNLVGNAVRAMSFVGTVDICLRNGGAEAKVSITDHGEMIPPVLQASLFDPTAPGTPQNMMDAHSWGLALPFCKMAVEAHSGRMEVSSTPEAGNTFTFLLPCAGPVSTVQETAQS